MHLRKYMHPRNKYKVPPNFQELARLYPEFHSHVVTDLSGKLRFNFKSDESLRVLTKTLLKHDFSLEVEIPLGKLVPALPLRLNYILWIEDLMKHAGITDEAHGIDIGTGAVCIYPLLCSKMYRWKMIATEINSNSVTSAEENIHRNHLNHLIKVISVEKNTILKDIIGESDNFSFTMCNPPFFTDDKSPVEKCTPPRNAKTGDDDELHVSGGEISFVQRMIDESILLAERVTIYTTMLGQKSSLAVCRSELKKRNIDNATWTEFCQGHTKRWGLAWSFCSREQFDLGTAPIIRTRTDAAVKKSKDPCACELVFPLTDPYNNIEDLMKTVKKWIDELKIEIQELKVQNDDFSGCSYQLRAYEDTWTHARRKRRMAMQLDNSKLKKSRLLDDNETNESTTSHCSTEINVQTTKEVFLECNLIVGELRDYDNDIAADKSDMVKICLIYHNGCGGKNALETFRQYFINKLGIREYIQQQNRQNSVKSMKKLKKKKRVRKTSTEIDKE